jgi:hypothetical protein
MIFVAAALWVFITTSINRFEFPEKNNTQLFLDIPKNFILRFEK